MSYEQAMSHPKLSAKRERELILAWQTDRDEDAKDEIVRTHMRVCFGVARVYSKNLAHVKDLAQVGVFGLMAALESFDLARGLRFNTWARIAVREKIREAVSQVETVVDIPARGFLDSRSENDEDATSWRRRQASKGEISLSEPVGEDGDSSFGDFLVCSRPTPEQAALERDRVDFMKKSIDGALLSAMKPREAEVLRRRHLNERTETLEEIASGFGVSRERIRQIEVAALDKLRRHLQSRDFPVNLLRRDEGH